MQDVFIFVFIECYGSSWLIDGIWLFLPLDEYYKSTVLLSSHIVFVRLVMG